MKTAAITTKFALGLMLAAGITACNQKKPSTVSPVPATANDKGSLIVYVNSDSLMSKYKYAKDVDQKLTEKGKVAQSDVQSKRDALQREYAQYQQSASTMPADQRQTTEQRLQREGQQEQAYEQNASAQFQNDRAAEDGKLFDKVADFVKQYAKQKGYKMVLTYSKASPTVLYGDPSLDITADIVKGLNDAYAKDGAK